VKVQGVDPAILNRIQEQTTKQAVHETRQTRIADGQQRQKKAGPEAGADEESLAASVKRLNRAAEAFNISLRFRIDRENNEVVVLVIDQEKQEVIRSIPPSKARQVLSQLQQMVGVLVDQFI
jgi:flagellar protein FlaG